MIFLNRDADAFSEKMLPKRTKISDLIVSLDNFGRNWNKKIKIVWRMVNKWDEAM